MLRHIVCRMSYVARYSEIFKKPNLQVALVDDCMTRDVRAINGVAAMCMAHLRPCNVKVRAPKILEAGEPNLSRARLFAQ